MKAARLRIHNVLGIEELEFELGAFTVVKGKNGTGKTSIIQAMRSLLGGGHDASLLRNGTDKGEVVLVLDDDTEISKTITADKSTLSVRDPSRGKISAGQTYLNKLIDALSNNPVDFLTCSAERRLQYVLEAAAIKLDTAQLETAVAGTVKIEKEWRLGHPLQVVDRVAKAIYDARTGQNAIARDSGATAEQLRSTIPPAGHADTLRGQAEDLAAQEQEIRQRYEHRRAAAEAALTQTQQHHDAIVAELEQRLRDAKDGRDRAVRAATASRDEMVRRINADEQSTLRPITDAAAANQARLDALAAAEGTRNIAAQHAQKAATAAERSREMTAALDRLEALKADLMSQSPIKGLEVRDGELYYKGVVWERVNTAEQVKVALRLAKVRAGDLPLVCVDGLEVLDQDTFNALRMQAPKSGLQFLVTRVDNDARTLQVEQELAEVANA